ncbi:MAG: hypothetical protein IKL55_00355 [Clostridia bacterium]|nr:hypothetical protein [Clostridia bacterium]
MEKTELLENVITKFGITSNDLLRLLNKRLEQKKKKQHSVDILIEDN